LWGVNKNNPSQTRGGAAGPKRWLMVIVLLVLVWGATFARASENAPGPHGPGAPDAEALSLFGRLGSDGQLLLQALHGSESSPEGRWTY
jgi:hypothetical protein